MKISEVKTILVFAFFILNGCVSPKVQEAPLNSKTEAAKTNICESENYKDNSEYKELLEKKYVNKLKNGELVYLQTTVQKCEEMFTEEYGVECGIEKTIKLVWEKDKKVIDSFPFLESGCDRPNTPGMNMEPWDQNDIKVKKDIVKVEHYWNYYVRSENEDNKCMYRVFKLDRKQMKLKELEEQACKK